MTHDPLVGRTIAGYLLKKEVGEGGTAQVYQAEHPERGIVALKVLRPRLASDPVAVKRFLREADFGARVVHTNVVRTYDYGEADGIYYLALEWASGEPLETFISRSGPVACTVAATIVEQLGAALEVAHEAGIIHRDLKPANIMYDAELKKARLLDFGIARDSEIGAEDRLTRAGFFVGTLQYVAPEALSGELVGEQADVYSLAVIAYQLLTEVTPFPGKNPRELFQQLLTEEPTPLNSAVKGLKFSTRLEEAVMKGLARDLSKRWKTVTEFTSAFCAAATAEPEKKGFFSSLFNRD
ncbi:MAG TPA: serine/threonine-protein kinase [Gemmatimonadales bacterium]|nr:serine/threonine-protein kinase [Gemmatimonadales bacterium]